MADDKQAVKDGASSDRSANLSSIETEYRSIYPIAEHFCTELSHQMSKLVENEHIILGFPIQHRVKLWTSLAEKFERVNLKATSVKDVQDLVGLRLILLFKRDVAKVSALIEKNFRVIRKYDTQERLKDDQFGYTSTHFIIELTENWLAVPTLAAMRGLRAELQIRTVAQHIWAEVSHVLQYKQKESTPPTVTRAIYRVSALLETVDLEFERVLEQRSAYRAEIDVSGTKDSLNVDLLATTLDSLLPRQNKSGDEDYAQLLTDLSNFEIKTQQQLVDLINKYRAAVERVEERLVIENQLRLTQGDPVVGTSRERTTAGVFYTHAGLTRAALNQEFGEAWEHYITEASLDDDELFDEFLDEDSLTDD